jgi:hypothetical protein
MNSYFMRSLTDAIQYWEPRRILYNAVLANVAYCAAYIPDVLVQSSGYHNAWRKYRWVVFSIGVLFAAILTRFIAVSMFLPASS